MRRSRIRETCLLAVFGENLSFMAETVKTGMKAVATRLGVKGRTETVALGIRYDIIS